MVVKKNTVIAPSPCLHAAKDALILLSQKTSQVTGS